MSARPRAYRIHPDNERELARRLDRAGIDREPVVIEIGGGRYRLVPVDDVELADDPAVGYDPDKVLAAIDAGAGAFRGMDVAAFLAEIAEAREQDTPGRPG